MVMEEWRAVVGFEGLYEVSSLGNVRSLDFYAVGMWGKSKTPYARVKRGIVLSAYENKARGNYRYVNLKKGGKQHMRRVARLVAAAFIGECPDGMVVCHNNGISTDDLPGNLRYDTLKSNAADQFLHGKVAMGENSVLSKLTSDAVLEIRSTKGGPRKQLAAKYGVHKGHVTNIRCGRRRVHD